MKNRAIQEEKKDSHRGGIRGMALSLALLLSTMLCVQAQVAPEERQALVDLYQATDGDNWTNTKEGNKPWLINDPQSPVSDWFGVTVSNGRVTRLSLTNNELTGLLPASIQQLSSLQVLSLGRNKLSGPLIAEVFNLPTVFNISLSDNQLSGPIPTGITQATRLTLLYLGANELSGDIPDEVGQLTGLTLLYLNDNQLTGSIPSSFTSLTKMRRLLLNDNQLTGPIPTGFGNLKEAIVLNLSKNQLSGPIPGDIVDMEAMLSLSLNANNLTGTIPQDIGQLTNLEQLRLDRNQLAGEIPASLSNCTQLMRLYLYDNQLSGPLPSGLGQLTNLQVLWAYDNQLSGALPANMDQLSQFTSFQIYSNQFVFSDLEEAHPALTQKMGSGFRYFPQANLQVSGTIEPFLGEPFTLASGLTGRDNRYEWFKDDQVLSEATSSDLSFDPVAPATAGNYTFRVTNSAIPNLVLESEPITVSPIENPCPVPATEKEALIDLYYSTDGPNWTNRTNWLSDAPVCDWEGVTVANGVVTLLELPENGLSGTIPASIGALSHLIHLDLRGNQIEGEIPPAIGTLFELEVLELSENMLTGSLPPALGSASQLQELSLSENALKGPIPIAFCNLGALKKLDLSNNELSEEIPKELGILTQLVHLDLSQNALTGSLPNRLTALYQLELLDLSFNQLSGSIPINVGENSRLETFRFQENRFIFSDFESKHEAYQDFINTDYQYAPQGLTDTPENQTVSLGGSTTLSTSLSSENNSYQWIKEDEPLDVATRELSIENASVADAGVYTLEATNSVIEGLTLRRENINLKVEGNCVVSATEFDALVALYQATNGAEWTYTINGDQPWNIDDPNASVCDWYGVVVEGGAIVELNLGANNLKGELPSSISDLSNLKKLDLSNNQLSGALPLSLNEITTLESLDIRNNTYVFSGLLDSFQGLTNAMDAAYQYAPQSGVGALTVLNLALNGAFDLSVPELLTDGGSYQWYKNGLPIEDATAANYARTNLAADASGMYFLEVTHPDIPLLTINSAPFSVNVSDQTIDCGISVAEREALIDFYQATGGDNWFNKTNWLSDAPICEWYGVKVVDGKVLDVSLPANNLTGSIPPSIQGLSNLEFLSLVGNQLTDEIPVEIGELASLQYLWLTFNQLSDEIPGELGELSNLRSLILSNNEFTGNLPRSIASLPELEEVLLDLNGLSGTIDDAYANLERFNISGNNFVFEDFEASFPLFQSGLGDRFTYTPQKEVGNEQSVLLQVGEPLNLSAPRFSNINNTYQWFKDDVPLTEATTAGYEELNVELASAGTYYLEVTNSTVTDLKIRTAPFIVAVQDGCVSERQRQALIDFYQAMDGPNWIRNDNWLSDTPVCEWFGVTVRQGDQVVAIDLPENGLRGIIPEAIRHLFKLSRLNLSGNEIAGEIPEVVGELDVLEVLQLGRNTLVGGIPESIFDSQYLRVLELDSNRLSGTISPEIINLQESLSLLDLSANKLEGTLPEELWENRKLRTIKLQHNLLSGGISPAITNLTSLHTFWVSHNNLSGTLPEVMRDLPLRNIQLDHNAFSGRLPFFDLTTGGPSRIFSSLKIENNRFVFADFETEFDYYRDNYRAFTYSPQARVDRTETIYVRPGEDATLFTEALTSPQNTYRWFKEDQFFTETSDREVLLSNIGDGELGTYYFTATNSTVDGLTLERNRLTVAYEVVNPPNDGCDPLSTVADGTFESCISTAENQLAEPNETVSCSQWDSPMAGISTVLAASVQPAPGAFVSMTHLITPSPEGGVFATGYGTLLNSGVFESSELSVELNGLESGAYYRVSFYQSNGGHTAQENGRIATITGNWKVGLGRSTLSSKPMEIIAISRTTAAPRWEKVQLTFEASNTDERLFFETEGRFESGGPFQAQFQLLIDGIKVEKVGGDCGEDFEQQSFCTSIDVPNVGDLTAPVSGIATWYETQAGGEPLELDVELEDQQVYWAEVPLNADRIPVRVVFNEGAPGVEEEDYQAFTILEDARIRDLEITGTNITWYDAPTGGTQLSSNHTLENDQSYYAQQGTNSCRFEVFVAVEVFEPDVELWQSFCLSDNPTLEDVQISLTHDHDTLIWYQEEVGGAPYTSYVSLSDDEVYYVVQRDPLGNESNRVGVRVSVVDVPSPEVQSGQQVFFISEAPTVSDLQAVGENLAWYDAPVGGNLLRPNQRLVNNTFYYASQTRDNCVLIQADNCQPCVSAVRAPVEAILLEEEPPGLIGCERFRPQPGERYVVSAWVREDGIKVKDSEVIPFSEVSNKFVDLLNYLMEEVVFSEDPKKRNLPAVFVPGAATREFDVLVPYVKGATSKNLTLYNFQYIKERQLPGTGPFRTIGFSFSLDPNQQYVFQYRTPFVRKSGQSVGYNYPLLNNPSLSLVFTGARNCNTRFCFESEFSIGQGTPFAYTENLQFNQSPTFSGIEESVEFFDYEPDPDYHAMTYANSLLRLTYRDTEEEVITLATDKVEFKPKGAVIDGWQRVFADFTIPLEAFNMTISLESNLEDPASAGLNVYFDDVRVHPYEGNMKSFVYDPVTQRLQAELDENNYATYYEYDQEGGLVRVKKETERGIYTIQETRSGNIKVAH
ncbi:MAG: hypothetical protein AAGA66_00520 [Bacteroidota bacterium]